MVEEEFGKEEFVEEIDKKGFATFYHGEDVLAIVATAPTEDNPMGITPDDPVDVAVALSYIECYSSLCQSSACSGEAGHLDWPAG